MATNTHYFTAADGEGDDRRRPLTVTLAGRDLEVVTASGVFSADRLDLGTRVLLSRAPAPPQHGDLLDLGCGWGPIALALALAAPAARVWAIDVNPRALTLTGENAARLGLANVQVLAPQDLPDDVRFAAIWSNPPIRVGKAALHAMLLRWLPRLADGAAAYLVVQRNLGADSLQAWLDAELPDGFTVTRHASAKGFRVLRVAR